MANEIHRGLLQRYVGRRSTFRSRAVPTVLADAIQNGLDSVESGCAFLPESASAIRSYLSGDSGDLVGLGRESVLWLVDELARMSGTDRLAVLGLPSLDPPPLDPDVDFWIVLASRITSAMVSAVIEDEIEDEIDAKRDQAMQPIHLAIEYADAVRDLRLAELRMASFCDASLMHLRAPSARDALVEGSGWEHERDLAVLRIARAEVAIRSLGEPDSSSGEDDLERDLAEAVGNIRALSIVGRR